MTSVDSVSCVSLKYALPQWQWARQHYSIPQGVLPLILLGLIAASLGEMLGYGLDEGKAMEQMRDFECHRERHFAKPTQKALID